MTQKPESLYTILNEAIKTKLAPLLKIFGFSKKGNTWNRVRKDFVDVVSFQISQKSSSGEHISFTINFGVCFPKLNDFIFEKRTRKSQHSREIDCIVRARPGELNIDPEAPITESWWDIKSGNNINEIFAEIEIIIKKKAIPFFDYFDSTQKIESFLQQKSRWYTNYDFGRIQMAILLLMNGKPEAARALLKSIINAKIGWKEEAALVAKKLNLIL